MAVSNQQFVQKLARTIGQLSDFHLKGEIVEVELRYLGL
jgi:hypothetical protein